MKAAVATLILAAFGTVSGFVGHTLNNHPKTQAFLTKAALEVDEEGTRYLSKLGFRCGVEAWATKTMTDTGATSVDLSSHPSTIPVLDALPTSPGQRTTPAQAFTLNGTRLVAMKLEPDSDVHTVLANPRTGATMIAEFPDPMCAQGSRVLAQITAARAALYAQVGTPQTYFTHPDVVVRITGIGFGDFQHGQTGVAPNAVELHPVIAFKRLK